MKITKVDILMGKTLTPTSDDWRPVFCRVYTDEGIYGDGEAALTYVSGSSAAFALLQDYSKLIIGMDPMDNEVIWDMLHKCTFWGQNGGPVIFAAISAIDIALWDIKGKALNLPLYKLLGGKFRKELRCYASQLQLNGWRKNTDEWVNIQEPEEYAEASRRAVAEGYDCIKTDFFYGHCDGVPFTTETRTGLFPQRRLAFVEERLAATREAVGPHVDIIMENHSFLDVNSAVQVGQMAEKYNIFMFEEATTPSPKMARLIRERVNIPQASGERIFTRWQYQPYFENGSLQVIQPDIGNCGGLTETKKICDMAHVYDVSVQAHVCASPLSTDVALHLETAIPNFQIHEHHIVHENNRNYEMALYNHLPKDGKISVSERPGIGNEIHPRVFRENRGFVTVQ